MTTNNNKHIDERVEEVIATLQDPLQTPLSELSNETVVDMKSKLRHTLTSLTEEVRKEERENFLGLVIRNCYGYTEIDDEKTWRLDLDSLESDLKTQNINNKES